MLTEINDDTFKETVDGPLDIVLFYKDKCPFCNAMKKILTKFTGKPAAKGKPIRLFQINRETSPEMTEAMEVSRIPSVMVFRNGEKTTAKSGDVTFKDLEKMVA